VLLYVLAGVLGLMLESAQGAFQVIISIGAGTGLLYLLRWFWWRINAWCEVVAMISSFGISIVFFVAGRYGHSLPFAQTVLYSVAFTTACWLVAAFFGPQTSRDTLVAFYRKVHPAGPGWTRIRREAGVSAAEAARQGDHMTMAALGWVSGCAVIWSSLFAIGNYLYGRLPLALTLTAVFIVSGATLLYVIRHVWDRPSGAERQDRPAEMVTR
jgi:hypothetical protein